MQVGLEMPETENIMLQSCIIEFIVKWKSDIDNAFIVFLHEQNNTAKR